MPAPTLTRHPRLKYHSTHFPDHLSCVHQSLLAVDNSLQPDYKFLEGRNDALSTSVSLSVRSTI